jgi:hypothetical protein
MDAKTRGWIIVQIEDWTLGQTDEDLCEVAERIYNAGCVAQAKAMMEAVRLAKYYLDQSAEDVRAQHLKALAAAQIVKGE